MGILNGTIGNINGLSRKSFGSVSSTAVEQTPFFKKLWVQIPLDSHFFNYLPLNSVLKQVPRGRCNTTDIFIRDTQLFSLGQTKHFSLLIPKQRSFISKQQTALLGFFSYHLKPQLDQRDGDDKSLGVIRTQFRVAPDWDL